MNNYLEKRILKIKKILADKNLDAILISNIANITYLSDFLFLISEDREGFILITKNSQYFISSFLYKKEILNKTKNYYFLELSSTNKKNFVNYLDEIIKKENLKTLAIESENITVNEFMFIKKLNVNIVPISLENLRSIKDKEEIRRIKKACDITDKVFDFILKKIKIGITENKIAQILENFLKDKNVTTSFPTIVAFGKNAATPHHKTNNTKLLENTFVLLDFGVKYENYCSDMTRTIYFGKANNQEIKTYEILKKSQTMAIDYLSAQKGKSILAEKIDAQSRNYLIKNGFPSFPHSLGHSIGINCHDGFRLSPISKTKIMPGMVFSIEPGIYITGKFGLRIEDDILSTNSGIEILTKSSRELIIIN